MRSNPWIRIRPSSFPDLGKWFAIVVEEVNPRWNNRVTESPVRYEWSGWGNTPVEAYSAAFTAWAEDNRGLSGLWS